MQKQISWKQNSYPSSSCDKRSWIERVSERVREREGGSDGGKKGIMQSYTNIIVFPRCTQMQLPKPDRIAYLRESTHTHTQTPYSWRKADGYIRQRLKPLPTKMRFTNNKMAKHKLMLTHSHTCTIYNGRFESDGDKISCKMLSLAYKSISRHEPNVYIFPILPFCHRVPRVPYTGIDSFTVDEKLYALIFCT